jgi:hypothetical protein
MSAKTPIAFRKKMQIHPSSVSTPFLSIYLAILELDRNQSHWQGEVFNFRQQIQDEL